jgi:hypothetical protein
MVRLLRYAGLANSNGEWLGGDAHLWFMGDLTDRGPDGVGVIDFVMRLQQDAERKGGMVGVVLGNHDIGILSALLFPQKPSGGSRGSFYGDWVDYGGTVTDLPRLQAQHVEWLKNIPAMALDQDRLLIHADALYYPLYGETMAEVNAATKELMYSDDFRKWDELLGFASERLVFDDKNLGAMRVQQYLQQFGGKQIIHGHSPINLLSGEPLDRITRAYVYANGRVVDVDGGIYKGGAGFVYEVPSLDAAPTVSMNSLAVK